MREGRLLGDHIHRTYTAEEEVLLCASVYGSAYVPLCRAISSHTGCKHERVGYKLAFQPDISDMISASHLVSLLFVSPVDFVQFELLLLRTRCLFPRRPGDVRRTPQRSCS